MPPRIAFAGENCYSERQSAHTKCVNQDQDPTDIQDQCGRVMPHWVKAKTLCEQSTPDGPSVEPPGHPSGNPLKIEFAFVELR